jgi:RNA polymerase sigma factor (sigma-70 family)
MHRYNRRLYRLARAVLRDRTEAEDALQQGYLSAYRLMDQFRGDAALSSWLSRLVLNECLGRLRRNTRRHNVVPILSPDSAVNLNAMASRDSDLPDNILGRAQMRALIEQKLDALPESSRVVS